MTVHFQEVTPENKAEIAFRVSRDSVPLRPGDRVQCSICFEAEAKDDYTGIRAGCQYALQEGNKHKGRVVGDYDGHNKSVEVQFDGHSFSEAYPRIQLRKIKEDQ